MAWSEACLRTRLHLDPSSRLATVHKRYRQDRQRSRSIWRTVTCEGRPIILRLNGSWYPGRCVPCHRPMSTMRSDNASPCIIVHTSATWPASGKPLCHSVALSDLILAISYSSSACRPIYVDCHWRRQLWDMRHVLPSTYNNLFFSVNFRAAQSLTAAFCCCLSKHICIRDSSRGRPSSVAGSRLHEPCSTYYSRRFMCDKKFHVVLCPALAPDPGDVTAWTADWFL